MRESVTVCSLPGTRGGRGATFTAGLPLSPPGKERQRADCQHCSPSSLKAAGPEESKTPSLASGNQHGRRAQGHARKRAVLGGPASLVSPAPLSKPCNPSLENGWAAASPAGGRNVHVPSWAGAQAPPSGRPRLCMPQLAPDKAQVQAPPRRYREPKSPRKRKARKAGRAGCAGLGGRQLKR